MKDAFRFFANKVSTLAGSAGVFMVALTLVVVWALTGPMFDFSSGWQLFINTLTTITTFLMVFLIQNTQNRDGRAMQLKLDELLRTNGSGTRQSFIDIEDISDDELEQLANEFKRLHDHPTPPHPAMHKLHKKVEQAHRERTKQR